MSGPYPYYVGFGVGFLIGAIWVYMDASEHTDHACVWGCLAYMLPFPIIPLYFIMRMYANRNASKRQLERYAREREGLDVPRLASDIDKLHYLEWAEKGPGTMYDPQAGLSVRPEGYRHFIDQRAETLLMEARYEEAWDYLIELYAVAAKDQDVRALDPYRNSLSRLPDGLERLSHWRAAESAEPPPPVTRSREVPF
jgi:hypothetical protein